MWLRMLANSLPLIINPKNSVYQSLRFGQVQELHCLGRQRGETAELQARTDLAKETGAQHGDELRAD